METLLDPDLAPEPAVEAAAEATVTPQSAWLGAAAPAAPVEAASAAAEATGTVTARSAWLGAAAPAGPVGAASAAAEATMNPQSAWLGAAAPAMVRTMAYACAARILWALGEGNHPGGQRSLMESWKSLVRWLAVDPGLPPHIQLPTGEAVHLPAGLAGMWYTLMDSDPDKSFLQMYTEFVARDLVVRECRNLSGRKRPREEDGAREGGGGGSGDGGDSGGGAQGGGGSGGRRGGSSVGCGCSGGSAGGGGGGVGGSDDAGGSGGGAGKGGGHGGCGGGGGGGGAWRCGERMPQQVADKLKTWSVPEFFSTTALMGGGKPKGSIRLPTGQIVAPPPESYRSASATQHQREHVAMYDSAYTMEGILATTGVPNVVYAAKCMLGGEQAGNASHCGVECGVCSCCRGRC